MKNKKKHQQEEDNRLSIFSPRKCVPIETSPLLDNQKAYAKEGDGPGASRAKPKRCKWKLQAKHAKKFTSHNNGPKTLKMYSKEIIWDSLKTKRKKDKKPNESSNISISKG